MEMVMTQQACAPYPFYFKNSNFCHSYYYPCQSKKLHNLPSTTNFQRVCVSATRKRSWDSNAETVRTRRFNFNLTNDDVEDVENDYFPSMDKGSGILEEFIDNVFIFKVFRSYGWMFPFIILSLLLVSGPKAFFLSLGIAVGVSAIALSLQKLLGNTHSRRKRKARTRTNRKSSAYYASNLRDTENEMEGSRKGKAGYRSWVGASDGSVEQEGRDAPTFGGWDDLDKRMDYGLGSVERPAQTGGGLGRKRAEKGRLSREKKTSTPLLLRLLIAVFPFLGSWTKLL